MEQLLIFSAKYLFLAPVVLLGIYFLYQERSVKFNMVVFAVGSAVLAYGAALIAKHLYMDPRPFVVGHFTPLVSHAADNGFPSDHTLLTSVLAAVGSYWNRKLGALLWVIALVVGFSRVYAGVHHPIDIIGGVVIATLSTIFVALVLKNILHRNIT